MNIDAQKNKGQRIVSKIASVEAKIGEVSKQLQNKRGTVFDIRLSLILLYAEITFSNAFGAVNFAA